MNWVNWKSRKKSAVLKQFYFILAIYFGAFENRIKNGENGKQSNFAFPLLHRKKITQDFIVVRWMEWVEMELTMWMFVKWSYCLFKRKAALGDLSNQRLLVRAHFRLYTRKNSPRPL